MCNRATTEKKSLDSKPMLWQRWISKSLLNLKTNENNANGPDAIIDYQGTISQSQTKFSHTWLPIIKRQITSVIIKDAV